MQHDDSPLTPSNAAIPAFAPVPTRYRYDGWAPDAQLEFIEALAECACVDEACRRVGKSATSVYRLRRHSDAAEFRAAWEAALDYGVGRVSDAAFARAIHGVAKPIFYKGEQIGEHRHFDERLTMFILRYRDQVRYGKWRDGCDFQQHQDGPAAMLSLRIGKMIKTAWKALFAADEASALQVLEEDNLRGDVV